MPQQPYGPQQPRPNMSGQQPAYPPAASYSGNAGYNPANPAPYGNIPSDTPSRSSNIMTKILLGAGSLLIVGAVAGIILLGSKDSQPVQKKPAQQATDTALADVAPRPDGVLNLSKTVDTSTSIKPQSIQAKLKEQVNLSSGFSFLVKDAGLYDSAVSKPAAGKKLIILLVVVGNRVKPDDACSSQSQQSSQSSSANCGFGVSYLDFKLKDSSNNLLNGHPATLQILNNPLAGPSEVLSGSQTEGRLIYEVEAAETEWTLVHSETYRKTTDNTTFTVEGRVAVIIKPAAAQDTPTTAPVVTSQ